MAALAQPPSASIPRASPFAPQPNTLRGWLGEAERRLAEAGIESARLDAQVLIAAVLGGDPGALRFAEDRPVESRDGQRIENFLRRRAKTREPVSRILGLREFWSLGFRITPAVLDPRPDSETLIEAALQLISNRAAPLAILDLGTGSGCLLLAALFEYPNAAGLGVDASEQALAVAQGNAERLGLAERAEFRKSDWASAVPEAFDLILCNPPYIADGERASLPPEVARHDPPAALFAGPDGLDAYRAILPDLPRLLAPAGFALFEIGATQGAAVSEIARSAGLEVIEIKRDLAGRDRCVVLKTS
jgi:release factor glutamine methyltransferase